MKTVPTHIILRTSLEVNGAGIDGFKLQEEAAVWARDRLLPRLESIFASMPELAGHIGIDRLELELESPASADWGEAALRDLDARLRAALAPYLTGRGTATERGMALPALGSVSGPVAFLAKLAHYMKHGSLPWNLPVRSQAELEEETAAWLASDEAESGKSELIRLLSDAAVRFRLRRSFSPPILRRLLARFFSVPETLWGGWAADAAKLRTSLERRLAASPGEIPSPVGVPDLLVHMLVESVAANGFAYASEKEPAIVEAYLSRLVLEGKVMPEDLPSLSFESAAFSHASGRIVEGLRTNKPPQERRSGLPPDSGAVLSGAVLSGAVPSGPVLPGPVLLGPVLPAPVLSAVPSVPDSSDPAPPTAASSRREEGASPAEREGIFIENAGLVLIAPFLPALFGRLGLAAKGAMVDCGSAMALLHYLATGVDDAAEFQLALPKALCGWDSRRPVDIPGGLPDEMKAEAGLLLDSVIEHWPALKNTSAEGFRESFLARAGKLTFAKDEWLLQVEQKAFDMLIKQVPWTISPLRLPWMKHPLFTDWVG